MTEIGFIVEDLAADALGRDADWWSIYDGSFPREEREPREAILRSLADGLGTAIRMRSLPTGGKPTDTVGIATLQFLPDVRCLFLVYLAVDGGRRGTGLGGQLFAETLRLGCLRHGGGDLDLVWEVDDPATAKDETELRRRERRLRFFDHQGGRLLPYPYKQPAVDRVAPVPMRLMWKPRAGGPAAFQGSAADLIRSIYHGKYGHVNGIPSGELDELLAGLEP